MFDRHYRRRHAGEAGPVDPVAQMAQSYRLTVLSGRPMLAPLYTVEPPKNASIPWRIRPTDDKRDNRKMMERSSLQSIFRAGEPGELAAHYLGHGGPAQVAQVLHSYTVALWWGAWNTFWDTAYMRWRHLPEVILTYPRGGYQRERGQRVGTGWIYSPADVRAVRSLTTHLHIPAIYAIRLETARALWAEYRRATGKQHGCTAQLKWCAEYAPRETAR